MFLCCNFPACCGKDYTPCCLTWWVQVLTCHGCDHAALNYFFFGENAVLGHCWVGLCKSLVISWKRVLIELQLAGVVAVWNVNFCDNDCHLVQTFQSFIKYEGIT